MAHSELDIWHLDQTINDRGFPVDVPLAEAIEREAQRTSKRLKQKMFDLTDGEVTSGRQVAKLQKILQDKHGYRIKNLQKATVESALADERTPPVVREILLTRQSLSLSSVDKVRALLNSQMNGRVYGGMFYYGAHTGRWTARLFQTQNLKRPPSDFKGDAIDQAVDAFMTDSADLFYDDPLTVASWLIRSLIKCESPNHLLMCDYANIEGRALAWLAGEDWVVTAFREYDEGKGDDLYKLTYARAFGIPVAHVTDDQRQIGKVMTLALGYNGGAGAFQRMAVNFGIDIDDDLAKRLVKSWRESNPKIKALWKTVEKACISAVKNKRTQIICDGKLTIGYKNNYLLIRLPSGRLLSYANPEVYPTVFEWNGDLINTEALRYQGVAGPARQWLWVDTYGGSLVENIVQALCRDLLAYALLACERDNLNPVFHVHDEIVCETTRHLEELEACMLAKPGWADELPIAVEGSTGIRFKK